MTTSYPAALDNFTNPSAGDSLAFSPSDLAPAGWWDASDTGTLTSDANGVATWNDKSTNAKNLGRWFTYGPNSGVATQNGLNVFKYPNLVNRTLVSGTSSYWSFLIDGSSYVVAAVVNPIVSGGWQNGGIFGTTRMGYSAGGYLYASCPGARSSGWSWNHLVYNSDPGQVVNNSTGNVFTTNTMQVVSLLADCDNATASARSSIFVNGSTAYANNVLTGSPSSISLPMGLTSDSWGNGGLVYDGLLAEVVIVTGANATEYNRARLHSWLNAKWAVY